MLLRTMQSSSKDIDVYSIVCKLAHVEEEFSKSVAALIAARFGTDSPSLNSHKNGKISRQPIMWTNV